MQHENMGSNAQRCGQRSVNDLFGAELISTAYSIEGSTTQSAWECDPMFPLSARLDEIAWSAMLDRTE